MRVEVSPKQATVVPGQPLVVTVAVTNTSDVISGHSIRLLGLDPRWVSFDRDQLSLFPGTTGVVVATLTLPADLPAGTRGIAVQVRELTPPSVTSIVEISLDVPAAQSADVTLNPVTATGGRGASFGVVVRNTGNTPVTASLVGHDEEEKLAFRFDPPELDLAPGEHQAVEMRVGAKRGLVGSPVVRPFTLRLDGGERTTNGSFVQRPWIPRGGLALVGLLAAVSIFAVVITLALSGLVGRSAADRDLALQVAQARQAGAKTGTAAVIGTVRLLTSAQPVAGVTVEILSTDDTSTPITSAATDDAGAYHLGGLHQGSYKLRFRGAGFAEMWYPQGLTEADAATVDLKAGEVRDGVDVLLGGLPATLSGVVLGDDPTGAMVALQVAGSAVPAAGDEDIAGSGAVLRTVTVASDGQFSLEKVPSPAVYDLVVSKPGYATEVQRIDLGGAEDRSGVEVRLRKGDGLIAGLVTSATGPVGGATISATYGQTTVQTVSVTQGEEGTFTLRGLPTPATFTIVVSKPGLASQTLTLSLSAGQQLSGVGVTLGSASGSLGGRVTTLADGHPASGVTVTVTNGDLTVSTVTQSTEPPGAWSVAGLPVPSTYTVTFSRGDLASQTLSVSLDAFGSVTSGLGGSAGTAGSADRIDASLRSATAVLRGTAHARDALGGAGPALGEIQITLTKGGTTYRVTTASTPAARLGQYEIRNLPPGTYTVSVNRRATRPTSTIITLAAGDVRQYDPILADPASIRGTVKNAADVILAGAEVRLYRASQYPTVVERTTITDGHGEYSFIDVDAPDSYVIEFSYPPGWPPAASRTVTIAESENRTVDLAGGG